MPKFAQRANLLHDLAAKSKSEYTWTELHRDQFEDLKKALTSAPVLATLDPEACFILLTDTSDTAIGGVLAQKHLFEGKMVERPLGYLLRKLHAVETRYPVYDWEFVAISANLDHWACYVYRCKRTTIYMDHAVLQHIIGQNKVTSRQWRHLDMLPQQDYEVKYYPGVANVVADALSRIAYTRTPDTPGPGLVIGESLMNVVELRISASQEWLQDIQKEYTQDITFAPILEHLQSSGIRRDITTSNDKKSHRIQERAKGYIRQDGLLFHRVSGEKLCIPQVLQADVIREAHDAILGGAAVASRYYWPQQTDTVAEWVVGCDVCHRVKHKNTRPYGLLQALPIPTERAERVNIDFITKLQAGEGGYDAVATIINLLTKRARWIPIKEAELTAKRFAEAFIAGYNRNRGLPLSLVSDRDTRFISKFLQALCALLGIKLQMSTTYHPQSDGQAEKANATLEMFLKTYISQLPRTEQWVRLLPLAEFAYNAAKHKAIGMAPFEADIGYVPRLPLDHLAPDPQRLASEEGPAYAEKLSKTLRMLRERMEETQVTMTTEANKKQQAHPFRVGDEVFLDTRSLPIGYANVTGAANDSNNSRKFQHPYTGPFKLLKKAGENAFVLDIPAHWHLHPVFNVARLKQSRVDRSREHPPPPPVRSTAMVEYEVETIQQHRGTTVRDLEYLVKWEVSGKKFCVRTLHTHRKHLDAQGAIRQGNLRPDNAGQRTCCTERDPPLHKLSPDDACQGIRLLDEECQRICLLNAARVLLTQNVKANVFQTMHATSSAFQTRTVRAFAFWTQCVSYRHRISRQISCGCRVSRQMSYRRRASRHLPSGRGVSAHLPSERSACLTDAECQGKCLPDNACPGICLPDKECQGICLLDSARVLQTQNVKGNFFQTQSVKAYVVQTMRATPPTLWTRTVRAFSF